MKMTNGIFKKIFLILLFSVLSFYTPHAHAQFASPSLTTPEEKAAQEKIAQEVKNQTTEPLKKQYEEKMVRLAELVASSELDNNRPDPARRVERETLTRETSALAAQLQTRMDLDWGPFQQGVQNNYNAKIKSSIEAIPQENRTRAQNELLASVTESLKESQKLIDFQKNLALQEKIKREKELAIDPFDCGGWISPDLKCLVASMIYHSVYGISETLLKLSGKSFDLIIDYTIVNMRANIGANAAGKMPVLDAAWLIFRDIANLIFLFALIYIAIRTILKGTSDTGKSIGTIIIVAVLINFSLFFTKVIVDFSNVAAISIYNSITSTISEDKTINKSASSGNLFLGEKRTLAEAFIIQTGISSSFNVKREVLSYAALIKQMLLTAVVFTVIAVVFLFAIFLLLTRYIILIVVMLLSSLAFGAYVVPSLKKQISEKWWSALIGQSFMAPVFMILMFVAFKIMGIIPSNTITGNEWGNVAELDPSRFIKYFLVVGLVIFALKAAKTLSDQAGGMAGSITKFLGGGALGLAAWAGRNTVGNAANSLASSMKPTSAFGGMIKRRLEGVANSSFDTRNSRIGGAILRQSGMDVGKAGKDASFRNDSENRAKAAKKRAASISDTPVNPNDPKSPTHREVYERSAWRTITGGASRRSQLIELDGYKKDQDEIEGKLKELANEEEAWKNGKGYAGYKQRADRAAEEIKTLQAALGGAIANNPAQEASIRSRIQAAQNTLTQNQGYMKAIDEDTTNPTTNSRAVFQRKLAETKAKIDNHGKEKTVTEADILKQLQRLEEAQKSK